MAGARLIIAPRLVLARWQRMASARESNNQMAIGGSCRPTEKFAARQSTGHTGQKKKLRHSNRRIARWQEEKLRRGNWGIVLAKRKFSAVIDGLRRPKEKSRRGNQEIALAKRKNHSAAIDGLRRPKENSGAAIDRLRRPKEKNCGAAIRVSRRPKEKLRRGNQGIAPASSQICTRLEGHAEWLAQGLRVALNGWREA